VFLIKNLLKPIKTSFMNMLLKKVDIQSANLDRALIEIKLAMTLLKKLKRKYKILSR
jgi:hypothetical protein